MSDELFGDFGFTFDPSLEEEDLTSMDNIASDPGVFLENTEGRTEFLAPDPERVPVIEKAIKQDTAEYAARPAEERTRELFDQMSPHRLALLSILDKAKAPIANSALAEAVTGLYAKKFSVYTPENLSKMLEVAGALERVNAEGEPYEDKAPEPKIVNIDGEDYYEPTYPEEVHWQTTAAGLALLESNNPAERLESLFALDAKYLSIYKHTLQMAARDKGMQIAELSAAEDSNPLIAKPRVYFVQHFTEGLERCEAILWANGAWRITEIGKQALANLADVEVTFVPETGSMPTDGLITESQGVNW